MPQKTQHEPLLDDGEFTVEKVVELNFFDLTGERAKTKGSSSKSYHAELCFSKTDNTAQIYTMWGATGNTQTEDWRHYTDKTKASKEFESIIKSKKRKGYKEVDIAQRVYGSDEARKITKAVTLLNTESVPELKNTSILHLETQRLIANLMGATNNFVLQTLKCPLGQLTNNQIDEGRTRLNQAKDIINKYQNKQIPTNGNDFNELMNLTNEFYSLIPHNFGAGKRGQMSHLFFDDINKVTQKEADLDTLLDAKNVGAVLKAGSGVDEQYQSLNADFKFVNYDDPMFSFINNYFEASKIRQHRVSDLKIKNIWAVDRKDSERDYFIESVKDIAKINCKYNYIEEANRTYKANEFSLDKRTDIEDIEMYKKANVWFCWHGTRAANIVGITKRGLLIRPAGAVLTGAMFGSGTYLAHNASKSAQYLDGGYWVGNSVTSSKYMFILDSAFGNMHVASSPHYYTEAPKGYHSVFGKANISGVLNDEMIVYNTKQVTIKYLVEIN